MDALRQVLVQVRDGKKSFEPDGLAEEDMRAFQPLAKALVYADQREYLKCHSLHESRTGNRYYSAVIVNGDLTYEGDRFLEEVLAQTPVPTKPTGWSKIDRNMERINTRLRQATVEVDFQQVGHLCRETLIDLAQEVFDEESHPPTDGTAPSDTDARRMLDAYLSKELEGGSNEEARQHAKAALRLANALTHRRTAVFRDAALCAEATASVLNIVAIVSGRRDPSGEHTN